MGYQISELSALTGVKAGTIRFYERCGFLEKAERLPNRYRVFNQHHIYQIQVCRLCFGGFVNKHLRRISMSVIDAASRWDLEAYEEAVQRYRQAVTQDIERTKKAISVAVKYMEQNRDEIALTGEMGAHMQSDEVYSKKHAAEIVGITPETIRNWERNGLLRQRLPYQKRFYEKWELNRMYVIQLLLDIGYSIMAILHFLTEYDGGEENKAVKLLMKPEKTEDLRYRADKYLETLLQTEKKANELCDLLEEMSKI